MDGGWWMVDGVRERRKGQEREGRRCRACARREVEERGRERERERERKNAESAREGRESDRERVCVWERVKSNLGYMEAKKGEGRAREKHAHAHAPPPTHD